MGNIYPYNHHGIVIFLSGKELSHLHSLMALAGALFPIALALELVRRRNLPGRPAWLPNSKWEEPPAQNEAVLRDRRENSANSETRQHCATIF
jgi:hypothetical protein